MQAHTSIFICKPAQFAPRMLTGLHGSLYDLQLMLMDDVEHTP